MDKKQLEMSTGFDNYDIDFFLSLKSRSWLQDFQSLKIFGKGEKRLTERQMQILNYFFKNPDNTSSDFYRANQKKIQNEAIQ